MAINIGDTITIRVVFRDWHIDGDTFGDPIDPDTVVVNIYSDAETDSPVLDATESATRESTGVYYYDFTPSAADIYEIEFVGSFSDGTVSKASSIVAVETEVDKHYLLADYEFVFISDVSPLLIDPEDLSIFYPEVGLAEIAELVYRFTQEVKQIYGTLSDLPFVAYEYVRAAVECSLFRMHGAGFSEGIEDLTLGNLSVTYANGMSGVIARGTANNPCELAAALRKELIRGSGRMRAVTKGSRLKAKIPHRSIKRGSF